MIGTATQLLGGRGGSGGAADNEDDPPSYLTNLEALVTGGDSAPSDPRIPLLNLSLLGQKMESLRRFLSDSVDRRVPIAGEQLQLVSGEIASAVYQVILNGSALLLASQRLPDVGKPSNPPSQIDVKPLENHNPPPSPHPAAEADAEIVEFDAAELMAEHVHFCDICGKGFRRDANLRMHMRAHGDRFKTLESLIKPDGRVSADEVGLGRPVRFSCPFLSCRRNRNHARFRPLKSAVCVRNHFRRSHCPKMYTCDLCNKKSFSVVADLKNHRKSCGETQWRCSCGTSFSRKDKLFGHVALFEGHRPAVAVEVEDKGKRVFCMGQEIKERREGHAGGSLDDGFFDGLMEEIGVMGLRWTGL